MAPGPRQGGDAGARPPERAPRPPRTSRAPRPPRAPRTPWPPRASRSPRAPPRSPPPPRPPPPLRPCVAPGAPGEGWGPRGRRRRQGAARSLAPAPEVGSDGGPSRLGRRASFTSRAVRFGVGAFERREGVFHTAPRSGFLKQTSTKREGRGAGEGRVPHEASTTEGPEPWSRTLKRGVGEDWGGRVAKGLGARTPNKGPDGTLNRTTNFSS